MSSAKCEVPSLEMVSLLKPSMKDVSTITCRRAIAEPPVGALNQANIYGPH